MINNEDNPKFWENIYKNDDAGWDLGGPTPVFVKISSILVKKPYPRSDIKRSF